MSMSPLARSALQAALCNSIATSEILAAIDAGGGGGGGSGTVSSGTAGQLAGYVSTGTTVSGVTLAGSLSMTGSTLTGTAGSTNVTNHAVVLGSGSSLLGAAASSVAGQLLTGQGASSDPTFASTGIFLDQYSSVITTDAPSAGAVSCNLATSIAHSVTMAVSTTITLTNPPTGRRQAAFLYLIQGGSGSCVPTFSPSVNWGTAGTPVWSTAVGKVDIIALDWNGTAYRGAVVGLGY